MSAKSNTNKNSIRREMDLKVSSSNRSKCSSQKHNRPTFQSQRSVGLLIRSPGWSKVNYVTLYTLIYFSVLLLLLLNYLRTYLHQVLNSSASLMASFTESLISFILAGSSEGSAFNSSVSICFIPFTTFS